MPQTNINPLYTQIKKFFQQSQTRKLYLIIASIIVLITVPILTIVLHGNSGLSEKNLKFLKFEIENKGTLGQDNLDDCAPECGVSQYEFEERINMVNKGVCQQTCLFDNDHIGFCNSGDNFFMVVGQNCTYDVKIDGIPHIIIANYSVFEASAEITNFSWQRK